MTGEIIELIRQLNGGSVIPHIRDDIAKHSLGASSTLLYRSNGDDGKYYYFSTYDLLPSGESVRSLQKIEQEALNPEDYIFAKRSTPARSYLLLFSEVAEETDENDIYREVIRLEENEFLFKKYVFYYTRLELDSFNTWYKAQNKNGRFTIDQLLQLEEIKNDFDKPHIQFFLRLLIKLPFIKISFRTSQMHTFEESVSHTLSVMRNKKESKKLKELNDLVLSHYNPAAQEPDIGEIAKAIIEKRRQSNSADL